VQMYSMVPRRPVQSVSPRKGAIGHYLTKNDLTIRGPTQQSAHLRAATTEVSR
jgi:hypothetical protein